MEITPIQWIGGIGAIAVFAVIFVGRVARQREAAIEHLGWAALAAASAYGAVKCGYPLVIFVRYGRLDIVNVYEYILIGLGIGLAAAIVAIVKSWNYRMPKGNP
jgi:hypothetical protein